ncbi:hypothetical protein TTHERM_01354280 (macronuclear) [Tetrahymena thermophila SB210]|uniref:Uncharacterized protein n=1 Tax=Tetrahymena thermophila (strain SB210) TaxID=312017 RepID=Q24CQ0_TETTS|nr:hypothetical protein TTHERM_01354280 [Tetrahymena thermophila SB210]EAS05559.3 hypothetical protein TTHERM_01354280 [Tetrahymena thermophila SB210]|eukprot:XP_001025804.3 hypothetical protein TTHERM_01354280 [Tetrahymena thermophila SB210]
MTLDSIQNNIDLQIIQDTFKELSQILDKIGSQIKQIEKDSIQYKGSKNCITKFLQEISQKIEMMISQLNQEHSADQQSKNGQKDIQIDIKKERTLEQSQIKTLSSIDSKLNELGHGQKTPLCQSPQKLENIASPQKNSKLKQQKSVQFQYNFEAEEKESSKSNLNKIEKNLKQTKSILKKSKTQEFFANQISPDEDIQLSDTSMADTDYCELRNHELINNLIQSEQINSKNKENYFYSESVTKLSKSGKQELKIICMTQNFFYVFPQKINDDNFKKFLIKDINQIIIDVDEKQKCSMVIKNEFQLNLIISHRKEFVDYIFRVFKNYLNALQPKIQYKQAQSPQLNPQNKYSKSPIVTKSSISKNKNQYYKIFILNDHTNLLNNNQKSNGVLLINNDQIIIQLSENNNLEESHQVKYLKKDTEARILQFQSLDIPNKIFNIQLQSEYDFPLLGIHLEFFSKQQLTIK